MAREPAPSYDGEGPFALWHFSEDPSLHRFEPHVPASNPAQPPLVWAIDTRHAPMFWFPRNCPRACLWAVSTTSASDRARFFADGTSARLHVIEAGWRDAMSSRPLYSYRMPSEPFRPHDVGGYWVSEVGVEAEERVVVDDLIYRHDRARIELRVVPSLTSFWPEVVASTVEFSGHRLVNAAGPEG